MRASVSARESTDAAQQRTNSNAVSESACVYGECDGSGFIYVISPAGERAVKFCRCREYNIMKSRMKSAYIPAELENLTVKSFNTELYSTEKSRNTARNIKIIAIEFVKKFDLMKDIGKGLYFYGDVRGSGKTRLAVSIGNALLTQMLATVCFVTTVNLLEEIKSTWSGDNNRGTEFKLLSDIKRVDVLILDDIGTERPTPWVNEIFFNILDGRMTEKKITIFTSNCRVEELNHDIRVISRIGKMALPVKFPDEAIRDVISKSENDTVLDLLLGDR